ncbi:PepSY-associated TM helix domain-containing protein [Phenylobacterium deserti]|uniref:PepSY domain-containing protein n=1 Tax=Phenylobacterium deserti TaxID=1914756 RepID=A0A328ADL2_9CAUL|nr:PepSY domain-containing protein [Phenylobacterium deserti]RAK52749.1 PepSY domain-containing protein [Phenylobacterium deserti]
MTPKTVRAWSFVHKWTSLICTVFLLMLCVTGLPLIFHHEIDDALGHDRWKPANPSGPLLGYDQILQIALDKRPGEVPLFMSFDTERPVVNVTTGPRADAPGSEMHFASFDRTSGELVPPVAGGGAMDFILELHTDMFLGLPGMLFLGAMGVLFAVAVVSGVVLYAPFMRKLELGALRISRSRRVKWLDYHNLLGVVTVAWVMVVGLTGVINTLATPIMDLWKTHELAALTAGHHGAPAQRPSSIDAAVQRAVSALPGMELQFVAFPGGSYSTERHYAVFFHGSSPLTEHLITPALIDAETGAFTAVGHMPWYNKALSLSQPLHFGDYGGLPLKILWALLDLATIVVLASGLYLWLSRRRAPAAARAEDAEALALAAE